MDKVNYQKELDKIIKKHEMDGSRPSLLLHACCAPCSSYVLEYLSKYFDITIDFYNPNISPKDEYIYRSNELKRLIKEMNLDVSLLVEHYDCQEFYDIAKGYELASEGGERCFRCYELRLSRAAQRAKEGDFSYFSTTLSISPLKNSAKLNEIGKKLSDEYKVPYLFSDFKKKEGYKRSIELSKKHNLYRQNFCGCIYSKEESMRTKSDE